MHLVCLDLEGVMIPEIWIAFSEATGISDFRITTREQPDYDKLMSFRIDLLRKNGLKLGDIQKVIEGMDVLPGAAQFVQALREKTQFIILSDTFEEFAKPLMAKLAYPTLFCNRFETSPDGFISRHILRQPNGKKAATAAFKSLNFKVFAAGDSYNDLDMLAEADKGCLFRAPEKIKNDYPHFPCVVTYEELLGKIDLFLKS